MPPTSTADSLKSLLESILEEAAAQYGNLGDPIHGYLGGLPFSAAFTDVDTEELSHLVIPPRWGSLLVYLLVSIKELHDNLHFGTYLNGNDKMLALRYRADDDKHVTVGLPLPPSSGPLRVQVHGEVLSTDTPTFSLKTKGEGEWSIGLPGPVTASEKGPEPEVSVDVTLSLGAPMTIPELSMKVGPLRLTASLNANGDPAYLFSVGLGSRNAPGVEGDLPLQPLIGTLATLIETPHQAYSPTWAVQEGRGPTLTLG